MTHGVKSSFIASMLCSQTWFESSFKVRVEPRINELLLNEYLGIKKNICSTPLALFIWAGLLLFKVEQALSFVLNSSGANLSRFAKLKLVLLLTYPFPLANINLISGLDAFPKHCSLEMGETPFTVEVVREITAE